MYSSTLVAEWFELTRKTLDKITGKGKRILLKLQDIYTIQTKMSIKLIGPFSVCIKVL